MKKLIAAALIATGLVGCVAPPKVAKTSLEIQAIQAKNFETDKSTAFKSVMSVLQDLGYVVASASLETGFITAESPTKKDESGEATMQAIFGGIRTELKTVVTASIEDITKSNTKIRLNFVNKKARSGSYGQRAADELAVEDATVYNNAFDKIGEAIFIRNGSK